MSLNFSNSVAFLGSDGERNKYGEFIFGHNHETLCSHNRNALNITYLYLDMRRGNSFSKMNRFDFSFVDAFKGDIKECL